MTSHVLCTRRFTRTPLDRTKWHWMYRRCFATAPPSEPEWLSPLREEMLRRRYTLADTITPIQEQKINNTLVDLFPYGGATKISADQTIPLGHHLVYFNPSPYSSDLLPDGTDVLHSPGAPWVRRMWAGGKLQLDIHKYFSRQVGWFLNHNFICAERVSDVQFRGQGDSAKIFVTIERRFARSDSKDGKEYENIDREIQEQMQRGEKWGHASLIEERNLVFMKARSHEEVNAIKEGKFTPVRYLKSSGSPDFSHTLTPTPSLLFRYSALTFNAHAIHLDPQYTREVEGHRNLLVHGPLILTLMLTFMNNYLRTTAQQLQPHTVQSIEYRNVAPLYCSEELRLCVRNKEVSSMGNTGVYEVWIEGPTGGMAVKGTVRTVPQPTFSSANRRLGP